MLMSSAMQDADKANWTDFTSVKIARCQRVGKTVKMDLAPGVFGRILAKRILTNSSERMGLCR